ncbi:nitrogen permease regulator 2 [Phaeosphaeriaceae sp. PMI808]|nr:nitrogen permease regulator 2 [Phaeosphaeriaceae sp. PMI808]
MSALAEPLFPFSSVEQYLIPRQQFCDRLLTFCSDHQRIIGYPVCIREGKYSRNEFIFNLAIVVSESERDWACYGEVVRKLGRLLRGLEEQGGFLSCEEEGVWEDEKSWYGGLDMGAGTKVYALCEMVLEDLNNYAECMMPIDDSNTINLKLFPTRPPPPPILAHQVPLLTISLNTLQAPVSSDLTLNRILPFVNGINSISRIAQLADTDLSLTRRAVQHLVYYGCLVLLDIFSFGAIYAPTAEISGFIIDDDVKDECMRYVRMPRLRLGSDALTIRISSESEQSRDSISSSSLDSDTIGSTLKTSNLEHHMSTHPDPTEWTIDHDTLIQLYTSLRQGLTLKTWVLQNLDALQGIDVRRLITFGIIKGFLYRVHKYAVATSSSTLPPAPPTSLQTSTTTSIANLRVDAEPTHTHTRHMHHPSFALHRPSTTSLGPKGARDEPHDLEQAWAGAKKGDGGGGGSGVQLLRFLNGMHCFDEICTEMGVAERVVEERVRGLGGEGGVVIQR